MVRRSAAALSLSAAAIAWIGLGWLFFDAAGVGRAGPAPAGGSSVGARADPCGLGQPAPSGFDRHCDLELRGDGGLLEVSLDETWQGNVLTQRLAIGAPSTPLWSVVARGAPPPVASRVTQVGTMPAGEGEHLAYTLGNCGAAVCGIHDVVVVGESGGSIRELHRERLGRGGSFELRSGTIVVRDGGIERTYRWDAGAYALVEVRQRPAATPSPSPR